METRVFLIIVAAVFLVAIINVAEGQIFWMTIPMEGIQNE